ncbi:MAG: hypothetical protein KatS3mg105_0947 [Gemmatales bacterium]|nr:MAG: hypothetical protein KatS3mg105_0947 [Gemmatales bacterium]
MLLFWLFHFKLGASSQVESGISVISVDEQDAVACTHASIGAELGGAVRPDHFSGSSFQGMNQDAVDWPVTGGEIDSAFVNQRARTDRPG